MEQNEMMDIHNIIMKTLKIVPKEWDANHTQFNSECHIAGVYKTTNHVYKMEQGG
jgi:hypothetical protein